MSKKESKYGYMTVGAGTDQQRNIAITKFVQASFKDHRLITVAELENKEGYILSVENPESSGRNTVAKMWLSEESYVALIATSFMYFSSAGKDMLTLSQEAMGNKDIEYIMADNMNTIPLTPTEVKQQGFIQVDAEKYDLLNQRIAELESLKENAVESIAKLNMLLDEWQKPYKQEEVLDFNHFWNKKKDYYGETQAAYEFAAEAYAIHFAQNREAFIPVSERKPSNNEQVYVVVQHIDSEGKIRQFQTIATYFDKYGKIADEAIGIDEGDYNEEDQEYYVFEGFYEYNDYEDVHYLISTSTQKVSHWKPRFAFPSPIPELTPEHK